MLPRFEVTMRQMRLMSKIKAVCRTYWPPVQFRERVGEIYEWIWGVQLLWYIL